jgi:hypothetical protein
MMAMRRAAAQAGRIVADLPLPVRWAVVAGIVLGVLGGIVGLVVGLISYPATAWFALFELGVPAGLLGAVAGLLAGSVTHFVRRGRPGSHTP